MKPYYQDEYVTIYHGDVRDAEGIEPASIPLIITSPPYNVGIQYSDDFTDRRSDRAFRDWSRQWLRIVYRGARDPSRLYLFTGDKMMWWLKPMCERTGWTYGQKLEWCKPNISGKAGRISGDWNYLSESILLFRKGKRTPMLNPSATIRTHNFFVVVGPQTNFNGPNRRLHPAQFPEELIMTLLARTLGDLVWDPFGGSGTTAVAAKRSGRKCIMHELIERYCEIAANRCRQAVMQLSEQGLTEPLI